MSIEHPSPKLLSCMGRTIDEMVDVVFTKS